MFLYLELIKPKKNLLSQHFMELRFFLYCNIEIYDVEIILRLGYLFSFFMIHFLIDKRNVAVDGK